MQTERKAGYGRSPADHRRAGLKQVLRWTFIYILVLLLSTAATAPVFALGLIVVEAVSSGLALLCPNRRRWDFNLFLNPVCGSVRRPNSFVMEKAKKSCKLDPRRFPGTIILTPKQQLAIKGGDGEGDDENDIVSEDIINH